MNPRRLEIFYQVIRYGGIAAAARQMTDRIDRTAVSKQINLLEAEVGARLFERHPLRLTRAGRTLYDPLSAIVETLRQTREALRTALDPCFRIGVEDGLRQSLLQPAAAAWLRHEPTTRVEVQTGLADGLRRALQQGDLDLAVTFLPASAGTKSLRISRPSANQTIRSPDPLPIGSSALPVIRHRVIATHSLVLLVPKSSGIRTAEHFWRQKVIRERLATPHSHHAIVQSFHRGLRQGGLSWPSQIVTDSLAGVHAFVSAGFGMGLTFDHPANTRQPGVVALPLAGFDPVIIACHWRGKETAHLQTALRIAGDLRKHPARGRIRG